MDVVDVRAWGRIAAGELCGVDPKTVKRKVLAHEAGLLDDERAERAPVPKNTDGVRTVVLDLVREANGRGTAKRLLPAARTAGYAGSDRNFRRLVAGVKRQVRGEIGRHQRRPAVWVPGETLAIDWGLLPSGLKVFCAVLAWSRVRFVRVARDETAATTLAMLADCFDTLGGVPAKVLADRMGCLKGGTIANVVIPTPDYVRFATHYRFVPDFCHPADPESKGIVENLVGYAKTDLVLPDSDDLAVLNDACRVWCCEVNARAHSEICAIPDVRLVEERALLRELPMLRPRIGRGGPQGRQAVHDPSRAGSLLGPTPTRRRTRRGRHLRRQGSHLRPRRRPRCRSRAARTRRSSRARRALPDTTTRFRHADREHAPMPNASSSPWVNQPRRSSAKAPPPG